MVDSKINIQRVFAFEVPYVWNTIKPGLVAALNHSDNLVTVSRVMEQVLAGTWDLYYLTQDKEYKGFAMVERLPSARGVWFNIPFAYSDDPKVDLHGDFLPFIEEEAKKENAVGVTFISQRRGYERKVKPLGYGVQFVKYKKEL